MSELMKQQNELSTDIDTITAEINAYQRVAGEAIFEIGRRLKHVKENDLAHGEFGKWLETISLDARRASEFITVFEQLGDGDFRTYGKMGMNALYQIATLPPAEREAEHVTSKGESKKPEDMTVKELRELKRQLKETEKQAEAERKERERLEQENEELSKANSEESEVEEEPYDRTMDSPIGTDRMNEFYTMMKEIDLMYKKYAHLKDAKETLRRMAYYDDDLIEKYEMADEQWRGLRSIFIEEDSDIIDVEII